MDYENQIIVQSAGLYKHTYKHIEEFTSIDSKYKDEICVVVKLRLKTNGDNYVATIYPVNQSKINRLKEKSLITV